MAKKTESTVEQLFNLSGKTALITGASGYLGTAMANALAEAGCRVVVASRTLATAKRVAEALAGAEQGKHLAVVIDHMDEASIQRGFAQAVKLAGQIDVLVNNGHEPLPVDWTKVSGKEFSRQLANATGYFLLARLVRDHAVQQKTSASIILLGSMYGMVGSYPDAYEGIGPASSVAYQALKGGVIHMTRHLAVYWAKDQVRVNCLSPGPFPSPSASPKMVKRLKTKSPMKRMGEAQEIKGAVVFLASAASSYVTGHNLVVDGGWTAW